MTKDDSKPAQEAGTATPAETKSDTRTPALTRVAYTGRTAGTVTDADGRVLVRHIEPGDVLEPETAKERKALLDSGHFELTRSRATTDGTPLTARPAADADASEGPQE